MDTTIRRLEEIWTEDGFKLGVARSLHFRPEEQVNADEQLFSVYLEVENFDLGDAFFVPVDYLSDRDPESDRFLARVTMKEVMDNTWTRMPDFVAKLEGREELLSRDEEADSPDPA